uniref:Transmembrane protein 65 n=1 Tax=Romanomermis culicivorax TaxID=13658 RepID=A0A915I9A4_ROMCU
MLSFIIRRNCNGWRSNCSRRFYNVSGGNNSGHVTASGCRPRIYDRVEFSTAKKFYPPSFIRLENENDAQRLVYYLTRSERQILHKVLGGYTLETANNEAQNGQATTTLTAEEVKIVFLISFLPFVGFGILDNLLMIMAGEYIDQTLGIILGISTMAAAGLGNIISDIAGVGLAHYIEILVSKLGLTPPNLTSVQWAAPKARLATNSGRCLGLIIGCLIGMFPLLFYDEKEKQEKKLLHAKETLN